MKNNTLFDSFKCVVNPLMDCDSNNAVLNQIGPINVEESEEIPDSNSGFQLIDFDKAFAN